MRVWEPRLAYPKLDTQNIMVPLGVAHRRELFLRYGGFDAALRFEEDWDLWKRYSLLGGKFAFSPYKSGVYHVRTESLARKIDEARGKSEEN